MELLIKKKIDLIAEYIFNKIERKEKEVLSFGLYSGGFGILLFLFYYSRYSQKQKHVILTEQ